MNTIIIVTHIECERQGVTTTSTRGYSKNTAIVTLFQSHFRHAGLIVHRSASVFKSTHNFVFKLE